MLLKFVPKTPIYLTRLADRHHKSARSQAPAWERTAAEAPPRVCPIQNPACKAVWQAEPAIQWVPRQSLGTRRWRSARGVIFFLYFLISLNGMTSSAQDAGSKKVAPLQELAGIQQKLLQSRLTPNARHELVSRLAVITAKLSPHYSTPQRSNVQQTWTGYFEKEFKENPNSVEVGKALARNYIDEQRLDEAKKILSSFSDEQKKNDHEFLAWDAWCQAGLEDRSNPIVFPLHFCFLVQVPGNSQQHVRKQCESAASLLNERFTSLKGRSLAKFSVSGFCEYDRASASKTDLVQLARAREPINTDKFAIAFNSCEIDQVRNRKAINIYLIDSYSTNNQVADETSHGKRNSNRPFLLMDWERVLDPTQNVWAHEMGHAFGLDHVGVPQATERSATNIMTSKGEGFGSGGNRLLGFTDSQAAVVVYHAKRTANKLGIDVH